MPSEDHGDPSEEDADYNDGPDLINKMLEGGNLAVYQVKELEKQLKAQPADLINRIKILGYHTRNESTNETITIEHILWIVQNHPDVNKLIVPLLSMSSESNFEKVKSAWLEQIERDPTNTKILMNAASYFRGREDDLVFELLLRAQSLMPNNLDIENDLAHAYLREAQAADEESSKGSYGKALTLFEHILLKCEDERIRFYELCDVAEAAEGAGELSRANELALEMLELSSKFKEDWNYGNAVFWANIVLGKLAFRRGDLDAACEHLILASETTGSPQLDSFGPEFKLCSQLLEARRADVSKLYLLNCAKFWKHKPDKLSTWIEDIDNGRQPRFRA